MCPRPLTPAADGDPGVSTLLQYRGTGRHRRPFVIGGNRWVNMWVDNREWWPMTADAVALYTLRVRYGARVLCGQPAR